MRRDPVAGPGGGAVAADRAVGAGALQLGERLAHPEQEALARDLLELHLGIVEVVDVDGPQAEVAPALLDLLAQVPGSERMAAGDDVRPRHEAGVDEGLLDVRARIRRPGPVERQEAGLAGDHHLLAPRHAPLHRLDQPAPDRALAALVAVVGCGVDHVQAGLESPDHRRLVGEVGRLVGRAEVSADSDRRNREVAQATEVPGRGPRRLAGGVIGSSVQGGAFGHHGRSILAAPQEVRRMRIGHIAMMAALAASISSAAGCKKDDGSKNEPGQGRRQQGGCGQAHRPRAVRPHPGRHALRVRGVRSAPGRLLGRGRRRGQAGAREAPRSDPADARHPTRARNSPSAWPASSAAT